VINWRFTDTHESLVSTLEHGALTWLNGKSDARADATVTTTRQVLEPVILGQKTLADAMQQGGMITAGKAQAVSDLWALLVDFKTGIPLVEPC
jgi:alkyl sulfatase BDS1-like metallo-beta-lactamase superfamily hydrolase